MRHLVSILKGGGTHFTLTSVLWPQPALLKPWSQEGSLVTFTPNGFFLSNYYVPGFHWEEGLLFPGTHTCDDKKE